MADFELTDRVVDAAMQQFGRIDGGPKPRLLL